MDVLNDELVSLTEELTQINAGIQDNFPEITEKVPNFISYSQALMFMKKQLRGFGGKLIEMYGFVAEQKYGQQFFKISQDLAQVRSKLKSKDEILSKMKKERIVLEREVSLLTGRIDSKEIMMENESLRSRVREMGEEILALKRMIEDKSQEVVREYEIDTRAVERRREVVPETPRFNLKQGKGEGTVRKESEVIVEMFEAGEVVNAIAKWKLNNFGVLETASDRQNFELLRKALLFHIKLSETLPGRTFSTPDSKTHDFHRLQEENVSLREKLAEKSNKLTHLYETQSEMAKSQQNFNKGTEEVEELKKLVYETSAKSLYLENQLKLIKSRSLSLQSLQDFIGQGTKSTQKINEFFQSALVDELEKIKNPIIENLRASLLQSLKEKTEYYYEFICQNLRRNTLERLLDEERKLRKLLKASSGISGLDNWKAYKRDYIVRMENAYKSEITELHNTIFSLQSEMSVTSSEVEEKYIKEMQELTSKLKKEHEDKKRFAEMINKLKGSSKNDEGLEKKYSDCRFLLQETNSKIFNLEQELIKSLEASQDAENKLKSFESSQAQLTTEKSKLYNEVTALHKKLKDLALDNESLKLEIEKSSELLSAKDNEIHEILEEYNHAKQYVANIEKELFETDCRIKAKEREIANMSKGKVDSSELELCREKFIRCKEKKKTLTLESQKLIEDSKTLTEQVEEISTELGDTKEKLFETEKKYKQLLKSGQEAEAEKEELIEILKEKEGEVEKIKRSLKNSERVVKEKEEKIIELEHYMKTLNESVADKEKKIIYDKNEAVAKAVGAERLLMEKEVEIQRRIEETQESSAEIKRKVNELAQKSLEITQKDRSLKEAEVMLSELRSELASAKIKIESLSKELFDKSDSLAAASAELSTALQSLQSKDSDLKAFESKLHSTSSNQEFLSSKIKDFYKSFCQEAKIPCPLLKKEPDAVLFDIYLHLISLCRSLLSSQQHIDVSFEEPQDTMLDYKQKYFDLVNQSALLKLQDSKELIKTLKDSKNLKDFENLPEWIMDKWQASLEDCDKLRQELILLSQELESRIKTEGTGYIEKAFEELSNYKSEIKRQSSELVNNHMRNTSLMAEIDYIKKEKYGLEKDYYKKMNAIEAELNEWQSCLVDVYRVVVSESPLANASALAVRNEILAVLGNYQKTESGVQEVLTENANLIKLSEKYSKELKNLSEKCEFLQSNLGKHSEIIEAHGALKEKFNDLLNEKEYLEEKLHYLSSELHSKASETYTKTSYEEKRIREELENELMSKCELVKQLADEIEKYKKYLKLREYEYQELLTLKDEEILRLRLKSS